MPPALAGASPQVLALLWALFGLFVGSFLNVCIHRLPLEGESVSKPVRSRCPSCRTTLTWRENVPVLSWLLQRGRCRSCSVRISMRYPLVELLTAGLWYLAALSTPGGDVFLTLVRVVVLSGLVVATFVDFDHFEIPDEVSIGGILLAPLVSLALPALHADSPVARAVTEGPGVDRLGALTACLLGMAAGSGVLLAIGWIGKRVYGADAMGLGDVKLLAAGGGFVGAGGVFVALMVAAASASVVGVAAMLRFFLLTRARARARGRAPEFGRSVRVARIMGRYIPFGPYLALGIGITLLYWNHVSTIVVTPFGP